MTQASSTEPNEPVVNNDPFHPANVGKVQLIVLMRIYDAQMAILANMNEEGEQAAEFIHAQHQLGKIVGSLPWLDLSGDESPSDDQD